MNSSCKILIVDDDPEDHLILRSYFEDEGITTGLHFVSNVKTALEFLEKIEDIKELPCLVILDLNMPMMNGTQALIAMKGSPALRNIPVIIYSTSENETEKRKCLSLGAAEYVVKPINYLEGKLLVSKFVGFINR